MHRLIGVAATLFAAFLLFGCAEQEPVAPLLTQETESLAKLDDGRGELKIMTWNIYVGTDVDKVLEAETPEEVPIRVAEAYQLLQQTNFPERARAIAAQIKRERPALIGLQEVSLIQLFDPTFTFVEQTDFLAILMAEIQRLGLDYRLADSIQNIDLTLPRFAGVDGSGNPILDYVRLLDADVILVAGNVSTSGTVKGRYAAVLPVNEDISIGRGYVSVIAGVGKKNYRFVATHLESFSELVRLPQAQELAYVFAGEVLPTIVVGDFNTDQGANNPYEDATYLFLTGGAGYADAWVHHLNGRPSPGYTWGHDPDLRNPLPNLTQRLDLVLVRNGGTPAGRHMIGPVQMDLLGDELRERTLTGMWPSDHAGLVAKFHMTAPSTAMISTMAN